MPPPRWHLKRFQKSIKHHSRILNLQRMFPWGRWRVLLRYMFGNFWPGLSIFWKLNYTCIQAVHSTVPKLEGISGVKDAKAVCDTDLLDQVIKWKVIVQAWPLIIVVLWFLLSVSIICDLCSNHVTSICFAWAIWVFSSLSGGWSSETKWSHFISYLEDSSLMMI